MNYINFDPRAFRRFSERKVLLRVRECSEYRPVPFRIAYAKEINTAVAVFVSILSVAFVVGIV